MHARILALGSASLLGLAALTAQPAEADVTFGALYPFSGELALLGEESFRGLELAVDAINQKGGVQGETVVLARGDAVDNNQAIGEARRLTSVEGVHAIFGTYSSGRSIAASQVTELAGIPYFEMGAVAAEITERGFEYLFRTNPTAKDSGAMCITLVREVIAPALGVAPESLKIALIHEDSSYGASVAKFQREAADEHGLDVAQEHAYPASTVDLSSVVLRLKEGAIDVVIQTSYQNDTVLFLRQAHEAGLQTKAVIGAGGGYSLQPTADTVGHDIINGVFDVDFTQYAINPESAPGIEAFVEAYQAKYGTPPRSGHSLSNYVGATAVLAAINEAEDVEPDTLRDAVAAIDIPNGGTTAGYGMKFDETGQNTEAYMLGMQWQDGRLVTIYPEAAAVAKPITR
ncbi:ABC transporter substrate-binding protein [Marinivivus vitaminiproducens]|uniref:ABC transporter substrate-binding protein n=1 Tax=Marinivivus vitaminiproducens TaxID=3035935 RepID=UPI0027A64BAC|nr:ABC transporter substrate-binding protein [Geminicoccaceae bacterium SCSIO 64248]